MNKYTKYQWDRLLIQIKACVVCKKHFNSVKKKVVCSEQCLIEKNRRHKLKHYLDNKEEFLKKCKLWVKNNPEKRKKSVNEYYQRNKEKISKYHKERYSNPKVKKKYSILNKNWKEKNKDRLLELEKYKYHNDILFKLKYVLRRRTNSFLKKRELTKSKQLVDYLGCSPVELKEHLEKQFSLGMSWKNYGWGWHIDHIIPLANAKTKKEIYKLCHYTNLQPLWAKDNLIKGSNLRLK